jgi:DNA-directed RNA polymerase I, II, and III subunit RPABC1
VIVLEPVIETFHIASMTALASRSLHVSFFQAHTIVNNPLEHVLVPKHELLPASEHAKFLADNKIKSKANLPLIKYHEDMIARIFALAPGDIVKITRPSPSAGEYISYRVCVP